MRSDSAHSNYSQQKGYVSASQKFRALPNGEHGYHSYRKPASSFGGFYGTKEDEGEVKVTDDAASCDCDSDLDLDSLRQNPNKLHIE